MDEPWPEVMGVREAAAYLRTRLGDLAPAESTLSDRSKTSHRDSPAARRLPLGVKVPGRKKRAWSRASLDAYADAVIVQVTALETPPGQRNAA